MMLLCLQPNGTILTQMAMDLDLEKENLFVVQPYQRDMQPPTPIAMMLMPCKNLARFGIPMQMGMDMRQVFL